MTLPKTACTVLSVVLLLVAAPLNAAPPAKVAGFVHIVTTTNICGTATVVNHPAANGNANAVLSVTYNAGTTNGSGLFVPAGPLAVYFDNATPPQCPGLSANRWLIYGLDSQGSFADQQRFNVIIVSP